MMRLTPLVLGIFLAAGPLRADDVVLSIAPEVGISSDHVTLCRVTARNVAGHAVDGRAVAFEAQAWEDGVAIMTEHGRFGGRIGPGETVESRIGFNGVFREFTIAPVSAKSSSRGGSGRGAKKGAGKAASKAKKRKP